MPAAHVAGNIEFLFHPNQEPRFFTAILLIIEENGHTHVSLGVKINQTMYFIAEC